MLHPIPDQRPKQREISKQQSSYPKDSKSSDHGRQRRPRPHSRSAYRHPQPRHKALRGERKPALHRATNRTDVSGEVFVIIIITHIIKLYFDPSSVWLRGTFDGQDFFPDDEGIKDLQYRVLQVEQENTQLHD